MKILICATVLVAICSGGASAADPLTLGPLIDGHSLGFFAGTADNPENLALSIACGSGNVGVQGGLQLTVITDDRIPSAARMLLYAEPMSTSIAVFKAGSHRVATQLVGVEVTTDVGGGWDMTVSLGPDDLPKALMAQIGNSPLSLTIGNYDFDMTPRQQDRAKLIAFLESCGDNSNKA